MRAALIAMIACACTPAFAQEAPTVEEALGPAAFAHYRSGRAHYDVQDYAAALAEFRAAYQINEHPVLVFAIAKTQQRLRQCVASIESLRRFLRTDPGNDWTKKANEEIALCENELEQEREARETKERQAREREEQRRHDLVLQAANDAARAGATRRKRWALALGGGGLAAGGVAVFATMRRAHEFDAAHEAVTSGEYVDHLDSADRWTIAAITLGAGGAALVVTGTVLWLTTPEIAVVPSREGAMVSVGGQF